MKALLLAIALIMQNPPSPNRGDEDPNTVFRPERTLSPAHDLYYEDSAPPTAEARAAIQAFGACVADRAAVVARDVLSRDFTSRSYDRGLERLASSHDDCFRQRGTMRSGNLLFAGAIAERLIERDAEPLNARLARAALRPASRPYSPTDQAAICVVRSVPDDVARLFETDVASDAETAASQSLNPVMSACAGGRPIEVTSAGLRSVLATAALRELNVTTDQAEARR